MKKVLLLSFLASLSFANAQKADVKTSNVTTSFEQPEFLKNTKTFSYTIQDDGAYWNYTPTDENPTIASNTDGLKLSGLTQVDDNADLQILVGFIGGKLIPGQAVINLEGNYNVFVLNKDNKLVTRIEDHVDYQVVASSEYDMANDRKVTRARMVTSYVQKLLKTQEHLFSGSADLEIPFGLFKKTKDGAANDFNTNSQPLIDAIVANSSDTASLDKAIAYWTSQLSVDFGKKVKDKIKNKVIYANLLAAHLLKKDMAAAKKDLEVVKENTGFFDMWTSSYKPLFERFESTNALENPEDMATIAVTLDCTYFTTLENGSLTYKDKVIDFTKIEITSIPEMESGMASLNTTVKPEIRIYEDDKLTLRYKGDDTKEIVLSNGDQVVFKEIKGTFKPCIKEGSRYRLMNTNQFVE